MAFLWHLSFQHFLLHIMLIQTFMCSSILTHQTVSPSHPPRHVSFTFPLVDIMGLGPNYMLSQVRQLHLYIPPLFYDPTHYAVCHNRVRESIYRFRHMSSYRVKVYNNMNTEL